MKTKIKDLLLVTTAFLTTGSMAFAMSPPNVTTVEPNVVHAQVENVTVNVQEHEEVKPAKEKVEKTKPTWRDNPNKCDQKTQWIAAEEPFKCIDKVAPTESVAPAVATSASKNARVPYGVHDIGGYGSCQAEIAKYDWGQSVALAVSHAESRYRPGVINNNPSTGDYSIGCFQVNIYGANAKYRPSQAELIDAAINVQWAYNNYVANGHSFIGQWGVCRNISCY